MNAKRHKVAAAVLGCNITGLQVIRSLGRAGVPVLALDSSPTAPGLFSKYAKRVICPDFIKDAPAFIDFLCKLATAYNEKPVLLPMTDPACIIIAMYKTVLDHFFRTPYMSLEALLNITDKIAMTKVAWENDITIPRTLIIEKNGGNIGELKEFPLPAMVKPAMHYELINGILCPASFAATYGNKGFSFSDREALLSFVKNALLKGFRLIVQEEIPGDTDQLYTLGVYADKNNKLRGWFTGHKIRQIPRAAGNCTLGEAIREDCLIELGKKIIRAYKFSGVGQLEFKKDPRNGKFEFIEINARPWAWIGLAVHCGVNLPLMQYLESIGEEIPTFEQKNFNDRWTFLGKDLIVYFKEYRDKNTFLINNIIRYLKSLRKVRTEAMLSLRDPLLRGLYNPFFWLTVLGYFSKIVKSRTRFSKERA